MKFDWLQNVASPSLGERRENGLEGMDRLQEQVEILKKRMRIAVIYGNDKAAPGSVLYQTSNTRSWKSYEAVAKDIAGSLRRLGFEYVEVMPDGMQLDERLRRNKIDLAWLNTGGVQGYNPAAHASSVLEMLGLPYVGHDPLAATTLDNKHAFKREAVCAAIPTAAFTTWSMARGPFKPELNTRFKAAFGDYVGPFVVKPVSGRASLHVHVVEHYTELPDVIDRVYQATENVVLIEKYLPGREFCIGVAGPITSRGRKLVRSGDPFTLSAIERTFDQQEKIFTSMDTKPITQDRFKKLDPVKDGALLERMRVLACEVFREFNLSSLIRLDIRCDEMGELYILEANPKPDLKQPAKDVTSLISAGLSDCGMDYDDLIYSLIADRLHFLFTQRHEAVRHILELLEPDYVPAQVDDTAPLAAAPGALVSSVAAITRQMVAQIPDGSTLQPELSASRLGVCMQQIDKAIECIQAAATELNLLSLNTMAKAMGADKEESRAPEVTAALGSQAA
jgi:D-alanine-D-alanine ligase